MKSQKRSPLFLLAFFVIAAAVAIPALQIGIFAISALHPASTVTSVIQVRKGQLPNEIAKTLSQQGVISSSKKFLWLGRLTRKWAKIKAGEYQVAASMTPLDIFSILTSGISMPHPITVREGENLYEIEADLVAKGLSRPTQFSTLVQDPEFIASFDAFRTSPPRTLEGYFFPDTYNFNRTMTNEDMARQMVRHFFDFWGPAQEKRATELGLNRDQLITLASMVEKETGAPEERPMIASVFYNRLKKGMRLQSDPTTIYGMWTRYQGKIHKTDLMEKNEYNTYAIPGLPIGPIGNPGRDAINATLNPADTPFLFFVSHNDGTHEFTTSLAEHNLAVQKFQLDPKAREGKSWRDLKKRGQQSAALQ